MAKNQQNAPYRSLNQLTLDQKRAVVAMIILLYKEQRDPKNEITIIGDYAEHLVIWHMTGEEKKVLCEQLVEKGIFCRQAGENAGHGNINQPVGDDNWYSFNSGFINLCYSNDFQIFGEFILQLEYAEAAEYKGKFFAEAASAILQSTYL